MDLVTENRLAALLMEEARRLRLQADKEGVQIYLQKPNIRGRPNSRFLTATVLGVQQANRAVEVNEMWRAREKELELDAKLENKAKCRNKFQDRNNHNDLLRSSPRHEQASSNYAMCSSSTKRAREDSYSSDGCGLRDYEVEEFLQSRAKRGRGAVGSRMDEPGPYMPSMSLDHNEQLLVSPDMRVKEEWECRILGPEKPSFLKSQELLGNSDSETENSKKHRSKERPSKRKNSHMAKRKENCSKHRHKSRRSDWRNKMCTVERFPYSWEQDVHRGEVPCGLQVWRVYLKWEGKNAGVARVYHNPREVVLVKGGMWWQLAKKVVETLVTDQEIRFSNVVSKDL